VLDDALEGKETIDFEFPLFTKSKARLEMSLNATPRLNAQGRVVGVTGVMQEITEKAKSQAELMRVAQNQQSLISESRAPMMELLDVLKKKKAVIGARNAT
jgi:hypothetical protein